MISKWIFHFLILLSFFPLILSSDFLPSSAKLPTTWNVTTGVFDEFNNQYPAQILSRKISNSTEMPAICFGFTYSEKDFPINFPNSGYILGIFARINCSRREYNDLVLWSANKNTPVSGNATLLFSSQGDLILSEANGTIVWSTNTSGKSVVGMRITATRNLLLYNENNTAVWSSIDDNQPTNIWWPGQKLVNGQRITADEGEFYLSVSDCGLCAFIESNPPQRYRKYFTLDWSISPKNVSRSIQFKTRSLNFSDGKAGSPVSVDYISNGGNAFLFMRLDNDGHLRVYTREWVRKDERVVDDIFTIDYSNCSYPTARGNYGIDYSNCSYPTARGNYGICSYEQCTCPVGLNGDQSYFKPIDYRQLSLGCQETTELSCNSSQLHLIMVDVAYPSFVEVTVNNTDIYTCKQACLDDCSCKAALFGAYETYETNSLGVVGGCSLISQVFSLMRYSTENSSSIAFLKVQTASIAINTSSPSQDQNNANSYASILGIIFGTTFFVIFVGVSIYVIRNKIRKKEVARENHLSFDEASGMPRRFSFEELKSATRNFHKKIGRGGFGSVYEGNLGSETIAVKCLDLSQGQGQGRKQFLAEVKTIGSIHHVNLVKLVGFCAENTHKLLAYEYMCNGSLDKLIFQEDLTLDWHTIRRVILDIARGLSYLHMECRKKIIHLDIKPQNILLDGDFNAKVSDFGLARFIENDESQVLTMIRGTRGYLAPEWFLNRRITEKVDVYSFGVVVLETVCGRRNLDYSLQSEESECLLHVIKQKAEEDALYDVLDKRNKDLQQHQEEAVKLIRTAIWCLQGDCTNRPSMSMVVTSRFLVFKFLRCL